MLKKTTYELWNGRKPNINHLRKCDSIAHVLIPSQLRDKLDFRTLKCRFIGYCDKLSGYRFFHKEKGIIEYRDVTFLENLKEEEQTQDKDEPLSIIGVDYFNVVQGNDLENEDQPNIEIQMNPWK